MVSRFVQAPSPSGSSLLLHDYDLVRGLRQPVLSRSRRKPYHGRDPHSEP